MSGRISRRLAPAALALLLAGGGGCGQAASASLDVCSPDPDLGAALRGGQLRLLRLDAAGVPRAAATVSAQGTSHAPLGDLAPGAIVLVEALDATGALVGAGSASASAGVGSGALCVCLARQSWYAYGTYRDAAGMYHDGPSVGFVLRRDRPPVALVTGLRLDRARVGADETLGVHFDLTSSAHARLAIRAEVLARPPGATHLGGLLGGFSPLALDHIDATSTVPLDATRTFGPADPPGDWAVFLRTTDALGVAHDSPEIGFRVGGTPEAVEPDSPIGLDQILVDPAGRLHGQLGYRNTTAAPVAVQAFVLTARPPGATNAGGPFDDFQPMLGGQTLAAGQTFQVVADRTFAAADDPCADLTCSVEAGQCSFHR